MSYWSCNDPDREKKEGRQDFERLGSWGYDQTRYRGHSDCDAAYTDGFNEAKRADERRREEREQEEAEERRVYDRIAERRAEEDYYEQMHEGQGPQS